MSKDPLDIYMELTEPRFDRIESKLDDLLSFKWKVYGIAAACGFIFGVGSRLLERFIDG